MTENEVTQKGSEVGGDQVGRDKYTNAPQYNFASSKKGTSPMSHLLKKFEEERKNDSKLDSFIEELDYFNRPIKGDVIGLEQKLIDGKREAFIDFALRAKESFHKKLFKFQFSESAQKINIHLLALVESYFMHHICPKIHNGHSSEEISSLIQELLVNPLLNELEENTLGFTATDINGMLYFLTGNCHIKWIK